MTYNGAVAMDKERIDACGTPIDAVGVHLDGSFGPDSSSGLTLSPDGQVNFVADDAFATQYGGLSLLDTTEATRTRDGVGFQSKNQSTINTEPKQPKPGCPPMLTPCAVRSPLVAAVPGASLLATSCSVLNDEATIKRAVAGADTGGTLTVGISAPLSVDPGQATTPVACSSPPGSVSRCSASTRSPASSSQGSSSPGRSARTSSRCGCARACGSTTGRR